jgi:replicative DNA helicase
MSSIQLVNRLVASETEIDTEKLKKGQLADHEWKQLNIKVSPLTNAPIYIDDTPGLSVFELRAKCRRLAAEKKIQMIIIDYLQLMTSQDKNNKNGNREQEISHISRSLKGIAKELNIPILALSQLSRNVERQGSSKKPQLSDLRESGAIEQDADMVMFIYRPEYYGFQETEDHQPTKDLAEIIVAKNRNGSLKTVPLKFIGSLTKFTDMSTYDFVDESGGDGYATQPFMPNPAVGGGGRVTRHSRMNDMPESDNNFNGEVPF